MIKGIIFDLDGTLLNTLGDLTSAINKLMINNNYPTYSEDDVRVRIGKGFKNLISRCIPIQIPDKELDAKVEEFKAYYFNNLIEKTKPYDGINELIKELKKRNIKIGVNSNKGNEPTKYLIKHFFNLNDDYVLGKREGFKIKPDPANNNEILSNMNLSSDEVLYVGDSFIDYETGFNSNLKTILVSWGFVDKEVLKTKDVPVIDKPSELLKFIEKGNRMNKKQALKIYKDYKQKEDAYSYAIHVGNFDKQTVAPKNGNKYANECLSYLYGELFSIDTCKERVEAIEYLSKCDDLDIYTKRIIELEKKSLQDCLCFTKDEQMKFNKACMDSEDAWIKAKSKNDYKIFEKHLINLVELTISRSNKKNNKISAYDVCLDTFEEGMNTKKYDEFFKLVKKELLPLIKKVNAKQEKNFIDDSFLYKYYPVDKQKLFTQDLIKYIGFDPAWGYVGEFTHPFTDQISSGDIRVTTDYDEHNIVAAIFSTIHECGHGFYMHNVDKKYNDSILNAAISSGMHESQSRFMENYIGRRKAFWKVMYPVLQSYFPENLGDVSLDKFMKAVNVSKCSLIRTEADELTYPVHILIRYEMEKEMIKENSDLKELNKKWNKKYKDYLGIDVKKDSDGILQDIHWSDASFGYFPTYALGSAIGAQLLNKMEKDLDIDNLLENKKFNLIKKYLKDNLQHYGALYDYNKLLKIATGKQFDPKYYIDYLKKKYSKLYEIKL